MAIQAQIYSPNLGFPLGIIPPDFMEANASAAVDGGVFGHDCFYPPPPPPHHHLIMSHSDQTPLHPPPPQMKDYYNSATTKNSIMSVSHGLKAEFEKQILEIDRFVCLQNERLRLGLQQQRKQQIQTILRKYEARKQILLRQKDEEISKAQTRTMELEETLRRVEAERVTWQSIANEKEAMVTSLRNTMEQVMRDHRNGVVVDDAESCCDEGQKGNFTMGCCKSCNSGVACSVVFLPCRHLSSCEACEAFLNSCPLCSMLKKATIHALL